MRWLLSLALLQGLIYVFITPPWEHYDEPGHFLYAAAVAVGEQDAPAAGAALISREVADSMVRHGFLGGRYRPDLLTPGAVPVAENQRVHPPLYYDLVAVPLRLVRFLSIDTQLYTARAVSLLLYVLTILTAWRITRAVLPDEPHMQAVLSLMVLCAPAFADLMAAVNNDVLLNFALTVALLGAVLVIRDGLSPSGLGLMLLGLAVAVAAKRTALAAAPPMLLALAWGALRTPFGLRKVLVGVGLVAAMAAASLDLVYVESPGEAHWGLAARPWLDRIDQLYLRLNLDGLIRSLSDIERAGGRYIVLAEVGFTSFWTRLSWGNVALPQLWDWLFVALAAASVVGLLVGAPVARRELPLWQRRCIWLFVLTVASACLALVVRLHPLPPPEVSVYIPRGRYIFWAIVPVIWLLALGVQWLTPERWRGYGPWALAGFVACTNVVAIAVLLQTYRLT